MKDFFHRVLTPILIGVVIALAFAAGSVLERYHWTEEVMVRDYAYKEDGKLIWRPMILKEGP